MLALSIDALRYRRCSLEKPRVVVSAFRKFPEEFARVNEYFCPAVEGHKDTTSGAIFALERHERLGRQSMRQYLVRFVDHS